MIRFKGYNTYREQQKEAKRRALLWQGVSIVLNIVLWGFVFTKIMLPQEHTSSQTDNTIIVDYKQSTTPERHIRKPPAPEPEPIRMPDEKPPPKVVVRDEERAKEIHRQEPQEENRQPKTQNRTEIADSVSAPPLGELVRSSKATLKKNATPIDADDLQKQVAGVHRPQGIGRETVAPPPLQGQDSRNGRPSSGTQAISATLLTAEREPEARIKLSARPVKDPPPLQPGGGVGDIHLHNSTTASGTKAEWKDPTIPELLNKDEIRPKYPYSIRENIEVTVTLIVWVEENSKPGKIDFSEIAPPMDEDKRRLFIEAAKDAVVEQGKFRAAREGGRYVRKQIFIRIRFEIQKEQTRLL